MEYTDEQLETLAHRLEQRLEELDLDTVAVDKTDDLREVAEAADAVQAAEARLREAVEIARAHGRSWGQLAIALGVSRQAAHQRFAEKIHA